MPSEPHPRTFDLGALRIRALAWPGEGLPTLLVHATSFCAETWHPVCEAARREGWLGPAIAVDQRGHGGSDAPATPGDYAWTRLGRDVEQVAEQLSDEAGGEPVLLVGHSSGGTAVLAAAGSRPDVVAGICLVEPVLYDVPASADVDSFAGSRVLAARARKQRDCFESRAAARERLRVRFPYAGFAEECLEAYLDGAFAESDDGSVRLRCPPKREAWMYEGAGALDLWPLVEKVRAPLLLVLGEHSAVPAELRGRLHATRVESVPGGTHFVALERPAEVGGHLARFAAELPR